MTIQLNDKSKVSVRWIDGRCKLTFHAICKAIVLPVGTQVTIDFVERMYRAYTLAD